MTQAVPGTLKSVYEAAAPTIARCLRLTPASSAFPALGFTEASHALTIDLGDGAGALAYAAKASLTTTKAKHGVGLEVSSAEAAGPFAQGAVTAADLRDGAYDHADFVLFETDWSNVANGVRHLAWGPVGAITLRDYGFTLELLGPEAWLGQGSVVARLGPGCDLTLGDAVCGVRLQPPTRQDSTAYTVRKARDAKTGDVVAPMSQNGRHFKCVTAGTSGTGEPAWNTTVGGQTTDGTVVWETILALSQVATVASVASQSRITVTGASLAAGHFDRGFGVWQAGAANEGLDWHAWIVGDDGAGQIDFFLPAPRPIQVGDTIRLEAGCRKRLKEDCDPKFDNVDNFFGAPATPGTSAVRRLRSGGL